jgi:hypothetical protein
MRNDTQGGEKSPPCLQSPTLPRTSLLFSTTTIDSVNVRAQVAQALRSTSPACRHGLEDHGGVARGGRAGTGPLWEAWEVSSRNRRRRRRRSSQRRRTPGAPGKPTRLQHPKLTPLLYQQPPPHPPHLPSRPLCHRPVLPLPGRHGRWPGPKWAGSQV